VARNLTPAERDALLERVVDGVLDGVDRLTSIEARLTAIERATGTGAMAILRESISAILDDRIKTSAFFAFLTVIAIIGGAIYLDSEAALLAIARGTAHMPELAPAAGAEP
jgi:hypothetical protein